MKFSSRPRVLIVVFIAAISSFATLYAVEKIYVEPTIVKEHERRTGDMPTLLGLANQKSIITNDLASLRTTLEQSLAALQQSGLRYIIIQDADGKVMTEVFHASIRDQEKDFVRTGIVRQSIRRRPVPLGQTSAMTGVDEKELSAGAREALTGDQQAASAVPEMPAGFLPRIERRTAWRLDSFDPPIVDYAMPITTGTIRFGGLRVGVVDDLEDQIRQIRWITITVVVLLIIVVGGMGLTFANQVDERFFGEHAAVLGDVRKEMEARIRQLETEHARREEENPITPSEFLALLDFARKISGSLDYNEVLHISVHSILQILSLRDTSIFVLDITTNELVGRIGHDENGLMPDEEMSKIRVPVGKGDIGAAAEFGTTTTIDSPRPGSAVVSALVSRGRTIGVILVKNKLNGRPFLKKDQTILRIFSGLLANGMENAAIFHHLNRG